MDYSTLSLEELKNLKKKYSDEVSALNNEQMAIKIMLNSMYGQLSNKYCRWFDIRLPRSITCTGQTLIRYIARRINELLNKDCDTEGKDYIITIDTDSVVGDTIINVDGKDITIAEYYNQLHNNYIEKHDDIQKYIKKGEGKTLSVNNDLKIENNNITYVMKHKVKKKLYKFEAAENVITVTENHSIMVLRNNELVSIEPENIVETDHLLIIEDNELKRCRRWQMLDLGEQEIDVYDVEVENNHNFFGNNILVHNSNYVNLDGIFQKRGYTDIDQLNDYIENTLEPYIDKCYREFFDYMNHFDFQMVMKREAIADKGIFINKKKRYCLSVIDMEGVRYAHPQLKIMGFEVIKSSTPEGVRNELEEVLKILLYKDRDALVRYIEDFREKFNNLPADKIAINKKVSELDKWLTSQYYTNKNGKSVKLGVPINSKAAINYNMLVDHLKLNLKKIEMGDKIKYVYLRHNPYEMDVIGFVDYLPKELGMDEYIDYSKQFEKVFLDNVKNITDDFGYDLYTVGTLDDLWD